MMIWVKQLWNLLWLQLYLSQLLLELGQSLQKFLRDSLLIVQCKMRQIRLILKHLNTSSCTSFSDAGQMCVEAAFLIPVILILLLVLLQPGIILYDKMVMQAAAGQGIRMLAVLDEDSAKSCENMVLSQLEAVPKVPIFRKGDWDIEIEGNETTGNAKIYVSIEIEPLPLMRAPLTLANTLNSKGCIEINVEVSQSTQPEWATSQGLDPPSCPKQWD